MTERIIWIDRLRGICMLLILWFHTEMYYVGIDIISYNLYVANALTCFFFLSGYLLYNPKPFLLSRKVHSIFSNLIIPYFFFTFLLAIPKAYVNDIPVKEVLLLIIAGKGSWFIAALIIAELLFSLLLSFHNKRILHISAIICIIMTILLTNTPMSDDYNYWNFHSALIGFTFIYLGYMYHLFERFTKVFNNLILFILLFVALITIKIYVLENNISLVIAPVLISNFPAFYADMIISIILLTTIGKHSIHIHWIEWIGSHSLVYYFFCGAIPMAVSKILVALHFYYKSYWQIPIVFIIICIISSMIVWISYKCLPFLNNNKQSFR